MVGIKKYSFLVTLLFCKLLFIQNVNSILSVLEYDCIQSLVSFAGIDKYTTLNSTLFIDYCSYTNDISCFKEEVTSVDLNAPGTMFGLTSAQFSCFRSIQSITLGKFTVDTNFVYDIKNSAPTLLDLEFKDCLGFTTITKQLPALNKFRVRVNVYDPFTVSMAWIQNINEFTFLSSSDESTLLKSTFINVGDVTNFNTLKLFSFSTDVVPDLTGFSSDVQMYLSDNLNQGSLANLISFSNVQKLLMYHYKPLNIPTGLFTLNKLKHLEMYIDFLVPTQMYDFSTLSSLEYLLLADESANQNNLGKNGFPISNAPKSLLEFYFEGDSTTLPNDMSIFRDCLVFSMYRDFVNDSLSEVYLPIIPGVVRIELYENDIYGTVPQSYCYTVPDLSNNKLTGSIPNCFTCFFGDTDDSYFGQTVKSRFDGNQFTNYAVTEPCSTMVPNSRLENENTKLVIYGESLGFNPKGLTTNITGVSRLFKIEQASSLFTLDFNQYSTLNIFENGARAIIVSWTVGSEIRDFTLSLKNGQIPIPKKVVYDGVTSLTITGEFFTYNKSDALVVVDGEPCIVKSSTFYQIVCSIKRDADLINRLPLDFLFTTITIGENSSGGGTTSVYITMDEATDGNDNTLHCTPELCIGMGNKYCNLHDSQCYPLIECSAQCYLNQGNCHYPTGECICKNNCNNLGTCDKSNGVCQCVSGSAGLDCSGLDCMMGGVSIFNCSNHGTCDTTEGKCQCNPDAFGEDCSTIQHYVTSIIPSDEKGGEVSLYGSFGKNHTALSVTIGSSVCIVLSVSEELIKCTVGPGKGLVEVIVNQNSFVWSSKEMYIYSSIVYKCPGNPIECTSSKNGVCNSQTGVCGCINNYGGIDCSSLKQTGGGNGSNGNGGDNSNPSVDEETGSGTINNGILNFEVSITSLLEFDYSGTLIKQYDLSSLWKLNSTIGNIHTFSQTIEKQCIVTSTIEEVINEKEFKFVGLNFTVPSGSLKLSLQILNYPYSSSLNTLQIRMKSLIFNNTELPTHCGGTEIDDNYSIDSNGFKNDNDKLNYLTVSKNGKKLYGTFRSKMSSNGRPTFTTSSIISSNKDEIIVGLNLPHCLNCELDPDFSVLLNPDFTEPEQCDNGGITKNTIIIISVICGVGGITAIGAVSYLIYRKKFVEKVLEKKLKRFNK